MLRSLQALDIICQYSADQFDLMITGTNEKHKIAPLIRIQRLFDKEKEAANATLSLKAAAVGDDESNTFT